MRKLFSMLLLTLAAAPVLAGPPSTFNVPEPEVMSLLLIGSVGLFMSRRSKK